MDRYQSFRTDLSHDDYDIFFARKAEWSEKLAGISDSTRVKLRAVLFRLMREAGVITPDSRILGTMLSGRFLAIIERAGAGEIRFFPGGQRLSTQRRA